MSTAAAIEARGLAKSFGSKAAVQPFELAVEPGAVTGLLGPNGSGKSTFLRMLVGLVPRDAGAVAVAGRALAGDGAAVRRRCTYMPGETALYKELRGDKHLEWLLRGRPRAALSRAVEVARQLGLPLERRVRAYSHGMKRQLLLAACMGPDVPVRILDEPTEGLDPTKRAEVLALLEADAAAGGAVLLSSHHLAEVDRVCERLFFLNDGRLLADERSDELHERSRRLVRLQWAPGVSAEDLAPRLRELGAIEIRCDEARATVLLAGADPRPFLARVAVDDGLPAPRAIVYGELSLHELYRDLYGVEGV
ncbi:MAG: ABC transporter ATP-binding protein [Planctomycetota bacterium]